MYRCKQSLKTTVLIAVIIVACNFTSKNNNSRTSSAQCNYIKEYYQLIYQADVSFLKKDYKACLSSLTKAFNSCNPIEMPMYYEISTAARCSALLRKKDMCFQFLEEAILKGATLEMFEKEEIFRKIMEDERWEKLKYEYPKMREKYLKSINLNLRQEIIKMIEDDQLYRTSNNKENLIRQNIIDSLNTLKIVEIFNKYGYPNEKIIGNYTIDNKDVDISSLLLHTKDSIRIAYFIPKLREFVETGASSPSTLGVVIDQYQLYNGLPQIYGTYRSRNGTMAQLLNQEKLDSLRTSIGLPPIQLQTERDSLINKIYFN